MDFSSENNDELVNRGESLWKWKTVDDFFRETGGQLLAADDVHENQKKLYPGQQ